MKIVLVNAKFSSDLEDGVTAECLEYGLRQRLPDIDIVNCDLAGRHEFGHNPSVLRSLANSLLPITPDAVKTSVYMRLFETMVRAKLLPHYDQTINGADIALFGGGQLLADVNLDFPMKIAAAASIVRDRNLPIAIHAVGVGADWSDAGAELFKEAFAGADIVWASVRNALSDKRWRRHFGNSHVPAPRISVDPAMLAIRAYASANNDPAPRRNRPLIGVNVTHPATLIAKADIGGAEQIAPNIDYYQHCVDAISAKDCDVLLFTNGAPDDEAYLRRCFPPTFVGKFADNQVRIAASGKTPAALVATIRNCDAIVSHGLNACVIAYSCKIPHVGLTLNTELDAFFDMVERRDFVLGPNNVGPEDVAAALARAGETPIDDGAHAAIVGRVEGEFDDLAAELAKVHSADEYDAASV